MRRSSRVRAAVRRAWWLNGVGAFNDRADGGVRAPVTLHVALHFN